MKNSIFAALLLLALMGGAAQAQTASPAATPAATPAKTAPAKAAPAKASVASTDPMVVMRAEQRTARNAFTEATRPIRG